MKTTSAPAAALCSMLVLLGVACSTDSADTAVAVTGTNDGCEIVETELPAGSINFEFTNKADDVSELYVLTADDEALGEVENVTTGATSTLTADLAAGDYQVRCKPGQSGDGISTKFTVTGEGGTEVAQADRTVTFDAVDFTYQDLDLEGISKGDTIKFEMANTGTQEHEFEVLDPSGEAVGEVAATAAGETGSATVTFDETGEYTYQCILVDPESDQEHTMLGMTGTFEVS